MRFLDATIDDAELISDFVSIHARRHIAPQLTSYGADTLLASMNLVSTIDRINAGWTHIFCNDDDGVCGIIVVKPRCHLYHLFVRTDRQKTGIGRSLFHVADLRILRDTGAVIASVNSSLNVIKAYERFGFSVDGPVQEHDNVRFQPMARNVHSGDTFSA